MKSQPDVVISKPFQEVIARPLIVLRNEITDSFLNAEEVPTNALEKAPPLSVDELKLCEMLEFDE